MKYVVFALFVSSLVLLSACDNTLEHKSSTSNAGNNKIESSMTENSTTENSKAETKMTDDYLDDIKKITGDSYFEDKAAIRVDDQTVLGQNCAVFKIGTNTEEKFTTENWIGVSEDGKVYEYDVAMDTWSEFIPPTEINSEEAIDKCIYMLNQILAEEFGTKCYTTGDKIKKAIYASEDNYMNGMPPLKLIAMNAETPSDAYDDPTLADYYPIYNFSNKEDFYKYLKQFCSEYYLQNIEQNINENIYEYDQQLYLIRGSRGYGAVTIDFDSLDFSTMKNNTLFVKTLLLKEQPYENMVVKFIEEDGVLKINGAEVISNYIFPDESLYFLTVPDFMAFYSFNNIGTMSNSFYTNKLSPLAYQVDYFGEYEEILPQYIDLLEINGFNVISSKEGDYYSLEKFVDDYRLTVDASFMHGEQGVVIEIEVH